MNHEEHFDHILDEALILLQKGKSIPEILHMFPEYKDELKDILEVSHEMIIEKEMQHSEKTFKKILHALPSLSQKAQKESYRYWTSSFTHIFNFTNMKYAHSLVSLAVVALLIVGGTLFYQKSQTGDRIDNWEFSQSAHRESNKSGFLSRIATQARLSQSTGVVQPTSLNRAETFGLGAIKADVGAASPRMDGASDALGFAVGGAKDINNFRENINQGYLPLPTDITYEGLFYDYYFDTGKTEKCEKLFCPSYATAVSKDPISGTEEYYLSVGLNSNLTEKDFTRKKLNLIVVLDISGSMESPFNDYYYDETKKQEGSKTPKIEIAKKAVAELTTHLESDDRFGMVLFDDDAYLAKPLSLVSETDMDKIRDHIKEIQSAGGTNMSAGLEMGSDLFAELKNVDPNVYENRIIFLTDAMPNTGELGRGGLADMTKQNAAEKIYSTFIGIGVDFNTDLIESLTKVRGANYYSVHSDEEFKTQLDDNFDYMVTPLVFDLSLDVKANGFEIEKVYGSPEADIASGNIMKINTLFPSPTKGGETKGGLVLLKLKKTGENGKVDLTVNYEDRSGTKNVSAGAVNFQSGNDYYENPGIRKGIVLARYANLLKNWTLDERGSMQEKKYMWKDETRPRVNEEMGIVVPPTMIKSEWERTSLPLRVSTHYKEMFSKFSAYFETEKNKISDDTLKQDIEILSKLKS